MRGGLQPVPWTPHACSVSCALRYLVSDPGSGCTDSANELQRLLRVCGDDDADANVICNDDLASVLGKAFFESDGCDAMTETLRVAWLEYYEEEPLFACSEEASGAWRS